jgi:hypothetical protein
VRDRQLPLGREQLVGALADRLEDARPDVVGVLRSAVARRERRRGRTAGIVQPVVGQVIAQHREQRHDPFARVGLGALARNAQSTGGEVNMLDTQTAELAHPRPGKDQRLHDYAPRDVVAVPRRRRVHPQLAAADLADQRVGDAELPGERERGGVGRADLSDGTPSMRSCGARAPAASCATTSTTTLCVDILGGVVFYRLLVTGGPLDDRLAHDLTVLLLRAIAQPTS